MFIDKPAIPSRLEVLLNVLHLMRERKADKEAITRLLQPDGLPDLGDKSAQAEAHLFAAEELQLIRKDEHDNFRLAYRVRGEHPVREIVIDAFDSIVLQSAEVEPWAARFYAYLTVQGQSAISTSQDAAAELAMRFHESLPDTIARTNPVNATKFSRYLRWYAHCGLGWFDPGEAFVPDPTPRLTRALPRIFSDDARLDAADFMSRLAAQCPELDGGTLFNDIASGRYNTADRICTAALASALRNLHDEKVICLHCPEDSRGWSLSAAGSVIEPGVLDSDRFDGVEWLQRSRA
jgi:hypothetical protein